MTDAELDDLARACCKKILLTTKNLSQPDEVLVECFLRGVEVGKALGHAAATTTRTITDGEG